MKKVWKFKEKIYLCNRKKRKEFIDNKWDKQSKKSFLSLPRVTGKRIQNLYDEATADKKKRRTKRLEKSSQNFWKLKKASYLCTPLEWLYCLSECQES